MDSSWICSSYPFRHNTRLHCVVSEREEGSQKCTENGLFNLCNFLYEFFVFLFTTNSILSTRHDFFYNIHFEKLSLRKTRLIKKIIII